VRCLHFPQIFLPLDIGSRNYESASVSFLRPRCIFFSDPSANVFKFKRSHSRLGCISLVSLRCGESVPVPPLKNLRFRHLQVPALPPFFFLDAVYLQLPMIKYSLLQFPPFLPCVPGPSRLFIPASLPGDHDFLDTLGKQVQISLTSPPAFSPFFPI